MQEGVETHFYLLFFFLPDFPFLPPAFGGDLDLLAFLLFLVFFLEPPKSIIISQSDH